MEEKILDYDRDWQKILDKLTFIENEETRAAVLFGFIFKHSKNHLRTKVVSLKSSSRRKDSVISFLIHNYMCTCIHIYH